jgi:hypothetical protein
MLPPEAGAPSMCTLYPANLRKKARKCFGAMASCSAISSAAAHLLAAFSSTFGKVERISTRGREERGATAS